MVAQLAMSISRIIAGPECKMKTATVLSVALAVALASLTSGCSLPKGAGGTKQILAGAEDENADFAVYQVNKSTVGTISQWPGSGRGGLAASGWIPQTRGPASNVISAGDRVDITVWETGTGTLLTLPGQQVVALQGLTVSPDGTVFLPYADKVYIANMTPDQAREAIQSKLQPIAPDAQVLIAYSPGRKSTVDLISGVPAPGTFPLPDRNFTVLSLLAVGGGIPRDMQNPYVRLMRDGKIYSISADRLLKDPSLDTTLRGGDKVYVEADERYFLSLGAAGREAQIPFNNDSITALDALSQIGGLNDSRADAKGILIMRDYPAKSVRADGSGPPKERMIFAIDITSADGLFSAGEFHVQSKDVVMIAESPLSTTQSILGILGGLAGITRNVQVIGGE
ncbi:MAG: polysaccharide export protein [Rhodobacter sp.]|nr:polysaccharide export protein [Rhodobacter sp.]